MMMHARRTGLRAVLARVASLMLLGVVGTGCVGAGGCVGYNTYPDPGTGVAGSNLNLLPMGSIMESALGWAFERYPGGIGGDEGGGGLRVVNLPLGVKAETYRTIAEEVGARPMREGDGGEGVYHIGEIRVRGSRAQVDMHVPGDEGLVGVTVYMQGGLKPWRVTGRREWGAGVLGEPRMNVIEQVEQAEAEGSE